MSVHWIRIIEICSHWYPVWCQQMRFKSSKDNSVQNIKKQMPKFIMNDINSDVGWLTYGAPACSSTACCWFLTLQCGTQNVTASTNPRHHRISGLHGIWDVSSSPESPSPNAPEESVISEISDPKPEPNEPLVAPLWDKGVFRSTSDIFSGATPGGPGKAVTLSGSLSASGDTVITTGRGMTSTFNLVQFFHLIFQINYGKYFD